MSEEKTKVTYQEFLATKRLKVDSCGPVVDARSVHPVLFPFQRDLTIWAARKGRCALFADAGLGKTLMQLQWTLLLSGKRHLIIAPLSVARQTINEADDKLGLEVKYSTDGSLQGFLTITNYEHAHKFDPEKIDAVVLDESSILKAIDGKRRKQLTEQFRKTRFKLCCTATPAPNDIAEIANHAEFLGIMSRADMMSAFFVHDSSDSARGGWRLKRHARDPFFRWLASWGMSLKRPSDIGYQDDGYVLPELSVRTEFVKVDYTPPGELIFTRLNGVADRARVRKATIAERVDVAAREVNARRDQWIVWCGLNEEGRRLHAAIDGSVLVEGSQSNAVKDDLITRFQNGEHRVLVTKPKIAGFGMNFQMCRRMAFVGLSDSWESYYQAIRRCWRFGQKKPVEVLIVLTEPEKAIYTNVLRKDREAEEMSKELIKNVNEFEKTEMQTSSDADFTYQKQDVSGCDWQLMLGDSCERMKEVADASVDLSVFSPPFATLYAYSQTERDLGNSKNHQEFFHHFNYVISELRRTTRPGRICCCHVQQLPATKINDGYIGMKDFRGDVIRAFSADGWIYHGEVCIDKDPQAQAIRTKAKGLLFVTKSKDSSWLRPAFADYILVFRAPGENATPIKSDVSNDEWIQWARPIWYGIKETETLQVREGRDEADEKHICPLQLETIRRCLRLWSNRGEIVLSPFAGIGSEGYVAVLEGRRFVGIELKESYFRAACRNLKRADAKKNEPDLLSLMGTRDNGGDCEK